MHPIYMHDTSEQNVQYIHKLVSTHCCTARPRINLAFMGKGIKATAEREKLGKQCQQTGYAYD